MLYRVTGAERSSGLDRVVVIDALDAPSASEQANKQGLLVSRIQEVPSEPSEASTKMRGASGTLKAVLAVSLLANVALGLLLFWRISAAGPATVPEATDGSKPVPVALAQPVPTASQPLAPSSPSPQKDAPKPEQSPTKTKISDLEDLDRFMVLAGFGTTTWSLSVQYEDAEHKPRTPEAEAKLLESADPRNDAAYIAVHRSALAKVIADLRLAGAEPPHFLPSTGKNVEFVSYDGKPSLVISGLTNGTVYNTLKLSSKERAAEVVRSTTLPIIRRLDALYDEKIAFYSVFVYYGSKSFTDDSVLATKGEIVGIVVSRSDVRDFVTGKITQEGLLRASAVWLADRDTAPNFNRVELQLR